MSFPRNRAALPGFVGFALLLAALVIPAARPAAPFLAVATAVFFLYTYRRSPLAPKRLAASIGFGLATAVGLLALFPTVSAALTAAIALTVMGLAASTLNTFANYCLGCQMHHYWTRLRTPTN